MKSRFAPSPTGFLHIGGARTALFSWLQARAKGGQFVLRVEDTDTTRNSQEATDAIIEAMEWLGLGYDEGPYFQSSRHETYRQYANQLVTEGKAYYCQCSRERLDALRESQMANKEKPRYDGKCRHLGLDGSPIDGQKPVLRFANPLEGAVSWDDQVRGTITFQNSELDDLIIWRSDDTPTYNFTVVVDDSSMGITDVLRGDDHINNTPRQINLYQALGMPVPNFAHVPMILGSDGKKLSKRHGAVNVMGYKAEGYLPEALVNYLARLGWSHGDQEIFSLDELIKLFDPNDINQSASAFNLEKLNWINQHWMRDYGAHKLLDYAQALLPTSPLWQVQSDRLVSAIELYVERVETIVGLVEEIAYLDPQYTPSLSDEAREKMYSDESQSLLETLVERLEAQESWDVASLDALCKQTAKDAGVKLGALGPLIRIAITGKKQAPSLGDLMVVAGKALTLARLRSYLSV